MKAGKLFLVPTPIGNLKDITIRALDILKEVDLIAAEDTRQSLKLLNHFNIKKPLVSYHKFNENSKSLNIIEELKSGKNVALVSDAGTPGISDPGNIIIQKCIEQGMEFEVLTGASALITGLVYSGLNKGMFTFVGFLPRDNKNRKKVIAAIKDRQDTLIFYESPHRLKSTLEFLRKNIGNRKVAICRELTKVHEEVLRFTIDQAINYYEDKNIKGEIVIVVSGKSEEEILKDKEKYWENMTIQEHLKKYMDQGFDKKESIKRVCMDRNLHKSDVYKYSIGL
ncbi:16S rRNA (cytidine(1402)-2'-O)-methyltransferase [Clostridium sp. cel8]|uniref:16S rRNA (cytidine(1402)-2'-O)-methyltransferase n=1 Tax=Clostridium sp. cel8 TaxID=2663123 RepID=UPI0015F6DF45|nr:16S rRNA (cytidine(1402)-2'-O)-methyltransferase [Clostridium sp. cel8]MBA5851407.1 16S rRNA (cytidine(1402)-2'-O)-methyltransferase [Clostridium sp. cel8]